MLSKPGNYGTGHAHGHYGKGAENNILIKDAESLKLGYEVDGVGLDKTGTIAEGKPTVTDLSWLVADADIPTCSPYSPMLFALEAQSEHPMADAVVERLTTDGVQGTTLTGFERLTGRGVAGRFGDKTYWIGNDRLLSEPRISVPTSSAYPLLSDCCILSMVFCSVQ